jgi:hypothetical protein
MKADTTNTQAASNTTKASPAKPRRRDFYNMIVIGSNGSIVPQEEWSGKIPEGADNKAAAKALKAAGLTPARVFQEESYKNAYGEYRNTVREVVSSEKKEMIAQSFIDGGMEFNQRLANSLATLLPLLRGASSKKTASCLRQIVKTVGGAMTAGHTEEAEEGDAKQQPALH